MESNKKGQVTLFVILGILVILIASLGIYMFTTGQESEVEQEQKEETTTPKSELDSFVDSCIRQVADEGMEIMRMQGGYINIPSDIKTLSVSDDQKIMETSKGKQIAKTPGTNEVPYYLNQNTLALPRLSLLENQMEGYISKRLKYCVNDFESFKNKGYQVEEGRINTSVEFRNATVIDVHYPIKLTKGDKVMEQEKFIYDLPINFRKMHGNALKLTMQEYMNAYLEHHMKSLISLYSYGGEEKGNYSLPPLGLTLADFSCSGVQWQKKNVKSKLQELFRSYMPMQKFARTNFTRIVSPDDSLQGTYDSFIENVLPKDMDLHINHSYDPGWGMEEFDIKPSSGNVIEPHEMSFEGMLIVPPVCTLDYSFKYTVKMPILFKMWSDDNNEYQLTAGRSENDFVYRFVMQSNLCGNQPRQCRGKPSYMQNLSENSNLSDLLNGTSVCDYRNSGNLTFKIRDYENNSPVKDVVISYYCGTEDNRCYVGRTDEQGKVTAKLPYCDNGVLSFNKDIYYDKQELLDVKSSLDRVYKKKMLKQKELNVTMKLIKAKDLAKAHLLTDGFTRSTCDGRSEKAVFDSLLHKANHTGDFVSVNIRNRKNLVGPSFTYPGLMQENPRIPGEGVSFPPGEYKVKMNYLGKVEIESSQMQGEEVSFDPSGSGPYKGTWNLGNMKYNWKVEKEDIINNDKVIFYMLSDYLPTDDLNSKDIQNKPTDSEGLISVKLNIPANSLPSRNCQNNQMTKQIQLSQGQYMKKLLPEFRK